jgi:hypothetical protein
MLGLVILPHGWKEDGVNDIRQDNEIYYEVCLNRKEKLSLVP